MLDNLLEIEVAYSLLKGGDGGEDPIDAHYKKLKTEIVVIILLLLQKKIPILPGSRKFVRGGPVLTFFVILQGGGVGSPVPHLLISACLLDGTLESEIKRE